MSKPNIEDVFAAFQKFQSESASLARKGLWSQKGFDAARSALQADLQKLGLAEHIDWTDRSQLGS